MEAFIRNLWVAGRKVGDCRGSGFASNKRFGVDLQVSNFWGELRVNSRGEDADAIWKQTDLKLVLLN